MIVLAYMFMYDKFTTINFTDDVDNDSCFYFPYYHGHDHDPNSPQQHKFRLLTNLICQKLESSGSREDTGIVSLVVGGQTSILFDL